MHRESRLARQDEGINLNRHIMTIEVLYQLNDAWKTKGKETVSCDYTTESAVKNALVRKCGARFESAMILDMKVR